MRRPIRWTIGLVPILIGCKPIGLGSDLIWSADFETGDTSQWSAPPGVGGVYVFDGGAFDASSAVTTERAHRGRYAMKFTSTADVVATSMYPLPGGCLYKQAEFPTETYYSAWYYIAAPGPPQTPADWHIMRFGFSSSASGSAGLALPPVVDATAPSGGDASSATETGTNDAGPDGAGRTDGGPMDAAANTDALPPPDATPPDAGATGGAPLVEISLRYLPPKLTVILTDLRAEDLESPLPVAVPSVPVNQWFQIEVLLRNRDDASGGGLVRVWFDGTLVYDVPRSLGFGPWVEFSPCSLAFDLQPSSAVLYVDDVAVSASRVSPAGILEAPP